MIGLRGKFLPSAVCGFVGCRFSLAAAVFGAVLRWLLSVSEFVSSGVLDCVEVVAAGFWANLCFFHSEGDFISLAVEKVGMPSQLRTIVRLAGCCVRGSGLC